MADINVNWETPDCDLGGTGLLPSRKYSQREIERYLAGRNWSMGQRLPHEQCPRDPQHHSHSPKPVVVLKGGLFCHSCAGRYGNESGFTGWNKLIGARDSVEVPSQDLRQSARHFCFFDHIRYVLKSLFPVSSKSLDDVFRLAYAAIIKFAHPAITSSDHPAMRAVFRPCPFVRGNGQWLHADTLLPVGRPLAREALQEFSSACWIDPTNPEKVEPDTMRVEQHAQDGALPGLPALVPVRGATLYFHFNRSTAEDIVRVPPRRGPDCVRYIPVAERMSTEDVAATTSAVYGGYDISYARLLMASKGVAESGIGAVPRILVHGVSGSQKTGGVEIVAAELGESTFQLTAQKKDNFGEALGSGNERSAFLLGDEVFKQVQDFQTSPLRSILLSINRTYSYRRLYSGSVASRFLSAIILCDTDLPNDLLTDEQIGRRFIYVPLLERVPDWKLTGVDWRDFWRSSEDIRLAFNSLYSDTVDRYFYEGSTMGFEEIAADLGYSTLEKHRASSEDGKFLEEQVVKVFWSVLLAKDTLAVDEHQGRGWRLLPSTDQPDAGKGIQDALESLAVQATCNSHRAVSLVKKYDGRWKDLVGAKAGARCETRMFRGRNHIRFCHGQTKGQLVNEELVSPDVLAAKMVKP